MSETQCDTVNIVVSDVRTLITILNSAETSVLVSSMEALTKFAELNPKRRVTLLNLSIIESLLKLMHSKDAIIRKNAIACVAACTEITNIHPDMRRKDLMQAVIELLNGDEPAEVHEEAAFTLGNLCVDFANKAEMRKNGGLKAVIRGLESADPDVKKQSAFALSIIVEDFQNRSELRFAKGVGPLIELLVTDHTEIKENALNCLIKCTEDYGNRIEFRKLNGMKKLIDLLVVPDALQKQDINILYLTLVVMTNVLEDAELSTTLHELGGLHALVKLAQHEDPKIKGTAEHAIAIAAKNERNQHYFREDGALAMLIHNLMNPFPNVISAAAKALAELARNDLNQTELIKLNVLETLAKQLPLDSVEVKRECVAAISSCCTSAKMRSKVSPQIGVIVKLLESDDLQTVINTADCLNNLCEDATNRSEVIRSVAIKSLLQNLSNPDTKVQANCTLALSRLLQDPEGRSTLATHEGIPKLIPLLSSKDMGVARNAAWAISSAAMLESLAIEACSKGALEALMSITRSGKAGMKFAADALEKLLNYHPAAKYWLRNTLSPKNQIKDGFFDLGYVGSHLTTIPTLPPLSQLQTHPIDKSREILLVDSTHDDKLSALIASARKVVAGLDTERLGKLALYKEIACLVSDFMGGKLNPHQVHQVPYKIKITELKLTNKSNVLLIGNVHVGVWYHRALLFKTVLDRLGVACSLIRGDYARAWNTVDISKGEILKFTGEEAKEVLEGVSLGEEVPCVVDLCFEPGKLYCIGTRPAEEYTRIQ